MPRPCPHASRTWEYKLQAGILMCRLTKSYVCVWVCVCEGVCLLTNLITKLIKSPWNSNNALRASNANSSERVLWLLLLALGTHTHTLMHTQPCINNVFVFILLFVCLWPKRVKSWRQCEGLAPYYIFIMAKGSDRFIGQKKSRNLPNKLKLNVAKLIFLIHKIERKPK